MQRTSFDTLHAMTQRTVAEELAPVLLEFAKAVYICQCFESSLCLLLSTMSHEAAGEEKGAFDASWDFHSKNTLGRLLESLRNQIDVPENVDEFLRGGVKKRNEIVHGFLTRNASRLANPKERLSVEKELVDLKIEIKRRDIVVNKLLDAVLKKYGLSNDILKRNADGLWNHMNPHPGSEPH